MSTDMTWLTQIKERLKAATPGPLEVVRFDNEGGEISYQLETKISANHHKILAWYTDLENPKAKADCTLAAHAPTDLDKAIRIIECYENMLSAIDRRAGSTSTQSGFTDAVEVAQWARQALAEAEKIKDFLAQRFGTAYLESQSPEELRRLEKSSPKRGEV